MVGYFNKHTDDQSQTFIFLTSLSPMILTSTPVWLPLLQSFPETWSSASGIRKVKIPIPHHQLLTFQNVHFTFPRLLFSNHQENEVADSSTFPKPSFSFCSIFLCTPLQPCRLTFFEFFIHALNSASEFLCMYPTCWKLTPPLFDLYLVILHILKQVFSIQGSIFLAC